MNDEQTVAAEALVQPFRFALSQPLGLADPRRYRMNKTYLTHEGQRVD